MDWHHNERRPGDGAKANSVYHEFDEKRFDTSLLIREVFQNLIDAPKVDRSESEPASVTFRLLSADEFDAAYFDEGFSEHRERLMASLDDHDRKVPDNVKNLLVFEEEGFMGLQGPLDDEEDSVDEERHGHHFRNFFFTQGIETKRGNSLGRTNKGKITYYAASEYLTVFALTRRCGEDPELALFGKTEFFRDYSIGTTRYSSTSLMHSAGKPSSDESVCRAFANAAKLENFDKYGTSWVIPNVDEIYLSLEKFIPILLKEFFVPIMEDKLIVNYRGETISRSTLLDVFDRYPTENLTREQLNFYESCLKMSNFNDERDFLKDDDEEERFVKIENSNWWTKAGEPNFGLDDNQVQALSKRINNNETLAFKVPINTFPKDRGPEITELQVFLKKKTDVNKSGTIKFIRSGLIITKEPQRVIFGGSEYEILVLATDEKLCDFLANAEDPSHNTFSNNYKISRGYNSSPRKSGQTLREVRDAAPFLVGLFEQQSTRDTTALSDLFPTKKRGGCGGDPPIPPPPPDLSSKFSIDDSTRGKITISCSSEMKKAGEFPIRFSVECTPVKSSLSNVKSRYSPKYDFDFTQPDNVTFEYPESTVINVTDPNKIDVEFKGPNAKIQLMGFHKRFEIETRIQSKNGGINA